MNTLEKVERYLWNLLVLLTQALNTILGGNPDEATSSRCWRLQHKTGWKQLRKLVDFMLGENHCELAYISESARVEAWKRGA